MYDSSGGGSQWFFPRLKVAQMKPPPPPILFRIVGKSRDGMTVTLGKYQTLVEAELDMVRLSRESFYRDLKIHEIVPPPPVALPVNARSST